MRRSTVAPLLAVGYALFLGYLLLGRELGKYLQPSYHFLTGGAILGLLALAVQVLRSAPAEADRERRIGALQVGVLFLPLVIGLTVPRVTLEAGDVDRAALNLTLRRRATDASATRLRELVNAYREGDRCVLPLTVVVDLLRHPAAEFDGLPIRTVGWLLRNEAGAPALVRYLMVCCAADLQPVGVELAAAGPLEPDDTWLVVDGRLGPAVNGLRPFIVETWQVIPAPAEPYLDW